MDTIPAQEISTQPVPADQVPISPQIPPAQKRNFRKFFNISSWVFLVVFLPITVLIFLSQDSLPGDFFYPVKRGMEGVILAAASVNPATKAAFRTDLTEARFKEAQSLVVSKSNASGLASFTDEVQAAQLEITNLTNNTERTKAEEKLIGKINEYQNGLSALQTKAEQNVIAYNLAENNPPAPTQIPEASTSNQQLSPTPQNQQSSALGRGEQNSPFPTVTSTPSPTPQVSTISQVQTSPTIKLTPTPTPSPTPDQQYVSITSTPTPKTSIRTFAPSPSPVKTFVGGPTLIPTPNMQVAPGDSTQILEQKKIAQTVKEAKVTLDKIKNEIEEKKPSSAKATEGKSEKEPKGDKNGDKEKSDKGSSDKKTESPNRQK